MALVLVGVVAASGTAHATQAGGCELIGTASFEPGLGVTPASFSFKFNGNLSLCQAAPTPAPAGGTVSLGGVATDASNPAWKWQEPVGTAQGGCAELQTDGIAIVRWAGGTQRTVMHIGTTSVLSEVLLTGSVVDNVTLTAVAPKEDPNQPDTLTIATNLFGGGVVSGVLQVTGPTTAALSCGSATLRSVTLAGDSNLLVP